MQLDLDRLGSVLKSVNDLSFKSEVFQDSVKEIWLKHVFRRTAGHHKSWSPCLVWVIFLTVFSPSPLAVRVLDEETNFKCMQAPWKK